MTTTIEYIAEGLKASLEKTIVEYKLPENATEKGKVLDEMERIYRDMELYESQGIPLTQDYLKGKGTEIMKYRSKWTIGG